MTSMSQSAPPPPNRPLMRSCARAPSPGAYQSKPPAGGRGDAGGGGAKRAKTKTKRSKAEKQALAGVEALAGGGDESYLQAAR